VESRAFAFTSMNLDVISDYFILPSTQQFSFYLFVMLYSALRVSTTMGHLQVLKYLHTIIKL
jgi:hypothetical protein